MITTKAIAAVLMLFAAARVVAVAAGDQHVSAVDRRGDERMTVSPAEVFSDANSLALAMAAKEGDTARIAELVKAGANINAQGSQGITALWFAMGYRHVETFGDMIKLGANPNIVGARTSVTEMAVIHPDPVFLRLVLEGGGDPNLRDPVNGFPLIGIALSRRKERISMLIHAGADVNVRYSGATAVTYAASVRQYDVVMMLLDAGADPRIKDDTRADLVDIINEQLRNQYLLKTKDMVHVIQVLKDRYGIVTDRIERDSKRVVPSN